MTEDARKMLTLDQVLEIVPVSESTLKRMIRREAFPVSYMISPQRCAWFEDEVVAWQRARPANDKIVRRAQRRAAAQNR